MVQLLLIRKTPLELETLGLHVQESFKKKTFLDAIASLDSGCGSQLVSQSVSQSESLAYCSVCNQCRCLVLFNQAMNDLINQSSVPRTAHMQLKSFFLRI